MSVVYGNCPPGVGGLVKKGQNCVHVVRERPPWQFLCQLSWEKATYLHTALIESSDKNKNCFIHSVPKLALTKSGTFFI